MADFGALAAHLAEQLRYTRLAHPNPPAFFALVAKEFETALPGCTRVSRQWGVFGGQVKEITLRLGNVRYQIESRHPPAYAVARQPVVHESPVGTAEELDPGTWEEELRRDLCRWAASGGLSAEALEKLLVA